MKLRVLALALAAWVCWGTPALAAWTVTQKGTAISASAATVQVSSQTYTAASIVALTGFSRGSGTGDTFTITGSVTGEIPSGQVYVCPVASSANKSVMAWAYATGGAETWTMTNSAGAVTAMGLRAIQIDGGATSSAEDTGARNCLTGQGTTPSISTTGTLAETGELILGTTGRSGSSMGYTEDATWTQLGSENGSGNLREAAGYEEAASTSAVTHSPTMTQTNNNLAVMAFKPAAAVSSSVRRGALLGVGQ